MAGHDVRCAQLFGARCFLRRMDGNAQGRHIIEKGRMGFQILQRTLETGNVQADGRFAEVVENARLVVHVAQAQRFFCVFDVFIF